MMINMVEGTISFQLRFGQGPIMVQLILQYSQAQPYDICTRVISLSQTLYVWSVTTLYHYTIESDYIHLNRIHFYCISISFIFDF